MVAATLHKDSVMPTFLAWKIFCYGFWWRQLDVDLQ